MATEFLYGFSLGLGDGSAQLRPSDDRRYELEVDGERLGKFDSIDSALSSLDGYIAGRKGADANIRNIARDIRYWDRYFVDTFDPMET
ncbi:hypothetical protein [Roseobacter weihaiensis]|uniref:hypothetical protein n=1 Tax=Roseobacter weihaiensis TaxID=2763262 RepID=UPI001D0AEB85|nr:hypothetical protein [Roseobacter sp. H9]